MENAVKTPTIPMHPGMLPQQRITAVTTIPRYPKSFAIRLDSSEPLKGPDRPEAMPPSAVYLCQLEWASAPWSCPLIAYYLSTNRCRRHWLLWRSDWDDNWGRWETSLCAYGRRRGVPAKTAAMHLLRAVLENDKTERNQEEFDWIAEDGYLDVPEILAVAREVWS
jgi:hypothetical protein